MKSFKIFPFRNKNRTDKSCWWEVRYFEKKADFTKALNKKCSVCKTAFDKTEGVCGLAHHHGFTQRVDDFGQIQKPNPKGELGIVFIQEEDSGSAVVAHELCHATLYTMMHFTRIINFEDALFHEADEKIAHAMGHLTHGYWDNYYKLIR